MVKFPISNSLFRSSTASDKILKPINTPLRVLTRTTWFKVDFHQQFSLECRQYLKKKTKAIPLISIVQRQSNVQNKLMLTGTHQCKPQKLKKCQTPKVIRIKFRTLLHPMKNYLEHKVLLDIHILKIKDLNVDNIFIQKWHINGRLLMQACPYTYPTQRPKDDKMISFEYLIIIIFICLIIDLRKKKQ